MYVFIRDVLSSIIAQPFQRWWNGSVVTNKLIGDCKAGSAKLAPAPMEMWMGTWSSTKVHSFSLNWHELKTLKLTLECELTRGDGRASIPISMQISMPISTV